MDQQIYDEIYRKKQTILSNFEIDLVSIGYLRQFVKNINSYNVPIDVINLFGSFFGYWSKYIFDTKQNVLFVSTDTEQRRKQQLYGREGGDNSPFVYNGKYAIYKKAMELHPNKRTELKLSIKVLGDQSFGIGITIYNQEMSNNLNNGKWIVNKNKYINMEDGGNFIHNPWGDRSKLFKWNANDICTVSIEFGQDAATQYSTKWILHVAFYKNTTLIERRVCVMNKHIYFTGNEYENIKPKCHIIIDNQPLYEINPSSFKLQLMESIDSCIIDKIAWWKHLNVGDKICFWKQEKDKNYKYITPKKIIPIENDEFILQYEVSNNDDIDAVKWIEKIAAKDPHLSLWEERKLIKIWPYLRNPFDDNNSDNICKLFLRSGNFRTLLPEWTENNIWCDSYEFRFSKKWK